MYNKRARLGGMAKDAEAQALCHSEGYAVAVESSTLASDANPAQRIASEKEEQGSGRSFCRKAEVELSVLCDDAGAWQYIIVIPAEPTGGFPRGARE